MKNNVMNLFILTAALVLLCSCSFDNKNEIKNNVTPQKQELKASDNVTSQTSLINEYYFEPSNSTVEGTLITRMYYGPPGYGEDPEKDRKEYPFILRLDKPINILAKDGDLINSTNKTGIQEIQVVPMNNEDTLKIKGYINKRVRINGEFFSAHTGHHHLGVLISVKKILESDNSSEKEQELSVQDFFPAKTMIKRFSGGFENGGFTHTIDLINHDKVQIKQADTGTGVIFVYQISENDIRLIFSHEVSDGNFKENYLEALKSNADEIILKAPIKIGTNWTDNDGGEYSITGVNNKVNTPVGKFEAIEVTFRRGDFEIKRYYARNIGLVKSSIKGHGEDKLIEIQYLDKANQE